MARWAARVDSNQSAVVRTLRALGASVWPTHTVGNGFPDLVVGDQGQNFLIEVKDGAKPPSERKLTPDEEDWHAEWRGQVDVIETEQQAIEWLQGIRRAGL